MRRLLLLSILMTVMTAYARQISPQEAASVAADFLNTSGLTTRSAAEPVRVADPENNSQQQPYYVFNSADENGFVIVSGDDRFSKILGYSDRGSFSFKHMPPQLKALLNQFAENATKSGNWNGTHPSWNAPGFSTRADEGVLLETADWGQDAPYNAETPMFDDQHAPTGCVATAMAIVMKYHKWPETYNWDAMPMKIEKDDENPPTPNPELARLMKDAGEAVFMSYGPLESGANMNWVGHRLQQVFKYSPDCQFITKQNFSNENWIKMIQDNLKSGNPVIYQGTDNEPIPTMNHAFILDGFNSTGYHVNWGWDGLFNGYYALDALTPNDSQDFSYNNGLVINIVPDKSGKEYSECFTDCGYFWTISGKGTSMNLSVENVKKDEPFHLVNNLINLPKGFEGLVGLALVSKDGIIKEVLQTQYHSTYSSTDMKFLDMGTASNFANVKVSVDVAPTDRLQLVTKGNKDSEFKLVLGTIEGPSSVSVVNNKPQYGKVKLTIGENVLFEYNNAPFDPENRILPAGTFELTPLIGTTVFFYAKVENPSPDEIVVVNLKGEKVLGLGNFAGDVINYSIDASEDSELVAKVVKLTSNTVNLTTAGTLKEKLPIEEAPTIKKLTITGKMNAEDFWYIRNNCTSLHSLDIKTVDIEPVKAADGKLNTQPVDNPANVIPEGALVSLGLLEELILPDNIVGIGGNSLMGMDLKKISIPAGVEFIGMNAFYGNSNLEFVEILNPNPFSILDCVFHVTAVRENGVLFVPKGSADLYREVEDWKNFNRIVEGDMPENVLADVVVDGLKFHCAYDVAVVSGYEGNPKQIQVPNSIQLDDRILHVTKIKEFAFDGCQSIENVILSENIVEIGERSFIGCNNLKSIKLNDNLKIIGREAFYGSYSLEECDLPKGLESLGMAAFIYTNLKRVTIPKNAVPQNELSVYGAISNLDKFIVEDGNPYFKAIDGILYRVSEEGLILECIPGQVGENVTISDECVRMREYAGIGLQKVKNIFFNKDLKVIERWALGGENIEHVTLPSNANISPEAWSLQNLKSAAFTGNLSLNGHLFPYSSELNNIFIDSPDEVVELDGIFDQPKEIINIFSSSPTKNFTYSDNCVVFVPGQCTDNFAGTRASTVYELWRYNINRKDKKLEVVPQFENLVKIDKVTINGKVVTPQNDIYPIEDTDNIDVKVEYTLLDRQKATTHYSAQFNNEVKDAVVTGMQEIFNNDSALMEVYTTDGILCKKGCSKEDLKDLRPGIYIIRQGSKTRKVVITK
ncbi:MAG: C10 family peptidase [Muribaculaceae bacterium]|nr:C10 family peptidase [Muribaculaceae bacterium]